MSKAGVIEYFEGHFDAVSRFSLSILQDDYIDLFEHQSRFYDIAMSLEKHEDGYLFKFGEESDEMAKCVQTICRNVNTPDDFGEVHAHLNRMLDDMSGDINSRGVTFQGKNKWIEQLAWKILFLAETSGVDAKVLIIIIVHASFAYEQYKIGTV